VATFSTGDLASAQWLLDVSSVHNLRPCYLAFAQFSTWEMAYAQSAMGSLVCAQVKPWYLVILTSFLQEFFRKSALEKS
jgi:hypothetical protein